MQEVLGNTREAPAFTLRDYQRRAVLKVRESFLSGNKSVVMVMPTGAGKSVCFAEIIRLAVEKGSKVLWLVHRRNLVHQMRDTLERFGIQAGVIMAGVESNTDEPVQIGTVQTYARRLQLDELEHNRFFIDADLVMIDEAHRIVSQQYQRIIKLYESKRIVGCTATPTRADGRGLGEVFDSLVDVVDVATLTGGGFLAPAKYYVPAEPDLEKIRIVRGDYDIKELGKRTNTPKLVGDVVENWLRLAEGLPTIVFAVNVKHSLALRDEFLRRGVTAAHLDARSTDDERDFVFGEVERGRITVLTNVAIYQEGLDVPGISCVVMARPTKSMGLYRQCLDSQTEVLTERGFLGLSEISKVDRCIGFDLESGEARAVSIKYIVARPVGVFEDMYSVVAPHVDIRVTGGHRMVFTGRRSAEGWKIKTAEELSKYRDGYRVPVCGEMGFDGVPLSDDEIRFVGLFLTDGCRNKKNNAISICQSEKNWREIEYIESCLVGCGFKFGMYKKTGGTQYKENGRRREYYVSFGKPRGVDKHLRGWGELEQYVDKDISPKLLNMSSRQFGVFLDSINVGDGNKYRGKHIYWTPGTITITSARKGFTDRLQTMAVLRGYRCNVTFDKNNSVYRIYIKKQAYSSIGGSSQKDRSSQLSIDTKVGGEIVWCVENELTTIITRRNGKVAVVGNCCGRGLRPQIGKTAIIIDHGGVVAEHGFLDDPVEWSLDGREKAWRRTKKEKQIKKPVKCSVCAYVFCGGGNCPQCGSPVKSFGKKVEAVDAELVEAKKEKANVFEKRRYLGMLKWWVREKGKNPKMINAKYKNRYGVWPHHTIKDVAPIPPDAAFYNRLKYDAIRWQKSQQKRNANERAN